MFNDNMQTKTNKTKSVYVEYAKRRLTKYAKKTGNVVTNSHESAAKLSRYLQDQRYELNYKQTTWRRIKAELKYYFESTNQDILADMIIDLPRLKIDNPNQAQKNTQKTSYKCLPEKLTKELIKSIENNDSNAEYSHLAISLIHATALTGIRPKEWGSLRYYKNYEGTQYHLAVVENAKNTNGRSFDKRRSIAIHKATDVQLESIEYIYNTAKGIRLKYTNKDESDMAWNNVYQKVRFLIYRENVKIRPSAKKTITLYSARHQFASDCKKRGLNEYDIATLMGHASTDTATRYYGRTKFGTAENVGVAPLTEQVAKLHTMKNAEIIRARKNPPDWQKIANDPSIIPDQDKKR